MRETRTEKLDRSKFAVYLAKAKNFRLQMEEAMRSPNFDSVAVLGIHCAISASDAVAVYYLGERSKSERHEDAAALLERTNIPQAREKARQLLTILQDKNLAEYEPRQVSEKDAKTIFSLANTLYSWAVSSLPSDKG